MYIASKHAGLGVIRQLAHEFAPHVRGNAVAPGAPRTNNTSPAVFAATGSGPQRPRQDVAGRVAPFEATMPLGTMADPAADHGAIYVLVASRTPALVITGTVIESDGGLGVRGLRRVRSGDDLPRRIANR